MNSSEPWELKFNKNCNESRWTKLKGKHGSDKGYYVIETSQKIPCSEARPVGSNPEGRIIFLRGWLGFGGHVYWSVFFFGR